MCHFASTQLITQKLIANITTQDELGIYPLISENITLTAVTNDGKPVIKQGAAQYIDAIREIWKRVVKTEYESYLYNDFNEQAGSLSYWQITIAQIDGTDKPVFSEGEQEFTFENGLITSIKVDERNKVLSQEEFQRMVAKIRSQQSKIPDLDSSEAILDSEPICVIL